MVLSDLPSLREMVESSAVFTSLNIESLEKCIVGIDEYSYTSMWRSCEEEVRKFREEEALKDLLHEL